MLPAALYSRRRHLWYAYQRQARRGLFFFGAAIFASVYSYVDRDRVIETGMPPPSSGPLFYGRMNAAGGGGLWVICFYLGFLFNCSGHGLRQGYSLPLLTS